MSEDELPEGWESVRVADVSEVRLGRQRSPDRANGPHMRPYMRAANVGWDGLRLDDVKEMDFTPAEFSTYELRDGDVLVGEASGSRSEVGKSAVWRNEVPGACFQNTLIRIRADHTRALPEFMQLHLAHDARRGALAEVAKGIGIHHLGREGLANWNIALPPLDEQRRIVARLDALRARSRRAKDALDPVPALLDRLRQSILAAAFRGDLTADWREQHPDVEPASELLVRIRIERRNRWEEAELAKMTAKGRPPRDDAWKSKYVEPEPVDESGLPELPEGWCWATIDEVGDVLLGRRRADREYLVGEDGRALHPYIRVANLKADRLDFSDIMSMAFSPREVELYRLRLDDIVLSEGQSLDRVGESAMYRGGAGDDLCIQATVHRFRAYAGLSPEFAQLAFMELTRAQVFRRAAAITTNIAHLTSERLRPLPFPLAPSAEQDAVVRRARKLLGVGATTGPAVEAARKQLMELDAAILAAAFRGELLDRQSMEHSDVTDSSQNTSRESAS